MDIKISGSGTICAGEYDDVRVSGSGRSEGLVRCRSFHCSGAFSGSSDFECQEDFHVSGAFSNKHSIKAGSLHVSGSAKNGADICADEVSISGSLKVMGSVRASELRISGGLDTDGDIEAENARISGKICCGGLINAEKLHIDLSSSGNSKAASIGGGTIVIENRYKSGFITKMFGSWEGGFTVEESIEGDEISIDHTKARTVSGRNVKIGEGCEIGLVQYTGEVEISPEAKVGNVEKI